MNTLLFLSLVASVLLFAHVDADPCGINACMSYTCLRTLENLQRTCGGGIISDDSCGCCGMCAKLEGESCGGIYDIGGTTCDIGLTCQPVGDKKFIFGGLGKCVRINPTTSVQPSTGTSEVNEPDTKSPTPASTTGTSGVKSDTKTQTPASTTGTSGVKSDTKTQTPSSTTGTSGVKTDTKTTTPASTTGTSGVKSDTKTQTPASTTGTSNVKSDTKTQTPSSTATTRTSGVKSDRKTQTPASRTTGATSGVKPDSKKHQRQFSKYY